MIICYVFIVINVYMYFEYLFMYIRGIYIIDKMLFLCVGCNYYEKFVLINFFLVFKFMFN